MEFTAPFGSTRRPLRLVDAAGFGCALGYGVLAWAARQPGEPSLAVFLAIAGWISLLTFGLYAGWGRWGEGPFPVGRLLVWAVVFRACGLVGGPLFEDDFYRYLWDGYRFSQDGTPYGVAPEAFFTDPTVPAAFQDVLDQVNYPELPTIYGPVTQFVFLAAYAVRPGSVLALQAVLVLVDLLAIGLLLRMAPARGVLLYAWCPLVVKEIAFTGHPDGVAVCLVLAAALLARGGRLKGAAACLALGAGAKVLALLLVPLVLVRGRLAHWGIFAGVLALLYLPFVWQGGTDLATLAVFAREWEFNAAVYGLLSPWMLGGAARLACGLAVAGAWCWYYLRHRRSTAGAVPRGDWVYGGFLALTPVVNPWYLLWLLPFAAMRPSAWAWTASVAVLLAYVTGLNLNDLALDPFGHPPWVRPVEYGLIAAAIGYDMMDRGRQNRRRAGSDTREERGRCTRS